MEYVVRYLDGLWKVIRIDEALTERVLPLQFSTKPEALAVAKHLQHAKRPAGLQSERAITKQQF